MQNIFKIYFLFFLLSSFISFNFAIPFIKSTNLIAYICLLPAFLIALVNLKHVNLKLLFILFLLLFSSLINNSTLKYITEIFQIFIIVLSFNFLLNKIKINFISYALFITGIVNSFLILFYLFFSDLEIIYNNNYPGLILFSSIYLCVYSLIYSLINFNKLFYLNTFF